MRPLESSLNPTALCDAVDLVLLFVFPGVQVKAVTPSLAALAVLCERVLTSIPALLRYGQEPDPADQQDTRVSAPPWKRSSARPGDRSENSQRACRELKVVEHCYWPSENEAPSD
jgi:hypothetical protein